jgi:hypothetical protein
MEIGQALPSVRAAKAVLDLLAARNQTAREAMAPGPVTA